MYAAGSLLSLFGSSRLIWYLASGPALLWINTPSTRPRVGSSSGAGEIRVGAAVGDWVAVSVEGTVVEVGGADVIVGGAFVEVGGSDVSVGGIAPDVPHALNKSTDAIIIARYAFLVYIVFSFLYEELHNSCLLATLIYYSRQFKEKVKL